jgi:hypothetical protein
MEAFHYRYHPALPSSGTVRRGGLRGEPFPASAADAVVKVRLTGDVYRVVGLPPCGR